MQCPNCKKELVNVIDDGAEVDACPTCKGVWVPFQSEKEFLDMNPQTFSVDELRRLRKLYKPLGRVDTVKFRACPACKDLMYRINWGQHSGVVVDRCEKHGQWYDEGEAEKIREYIQLGGVEYEKLRITERGLQELQSKLLEETTRTRVRINTQFRNPRLWTLIGW